METGPTIVITIAVGRKKCDCCGFGICKISIDISLGERTKLALIEKCEKAEIEFLERPRKLGDVLYVDSDVELPKEAAYALGYDSISILRGEYKMDYVRSVWGKTTVMVKMGNRVEKPTEEC